MTDLRKVTWASMKSIVGWFGCLDAAAETINGRWGGGVSKGTISRKMSGTLDWTIADVIALEDAVGRYPVTRIMARRLENKPELNAENLVSQSGAIAKESGEAVAAILTAEQSPNTGAKAVAITEIDEAIYALRQARARLEPVGQIAKVN
jgi:hypothetical protein